MKTTGENRRVLRARNEMRCRHILDGARPLVIDDLDWNAVGAVAVDAAVLDTLVYMRDVEGFTDRDLVGLTADRSTLGDPLLRDFLEAVATGRGVPRTGARSLSRRVRVGNAASSRRPGSFHRPRSHRCGNA